MRKEILPEYGFGYNIKKFITPDVEYQDFKDYYYDYITYYEIGDMIIVDKLELIDFIILLNYFCELGSYNITKKVEEAFYDVATDDALGAVIERFITLVVGNKTIYLTTRTSEFIKEN